MTDPLHGVVVVDKPIGPTSFAVVRQARRATGARKVGHGGTLDPLASGVLPICFGEATKLAQFLLDADKEYEATVQFGVETDTYDATGTVTARAATAELTADAIRRALATFTGEQHQVPPMYSALKRAGRPLYSYARAGETVERAPRTVKVHTLELRGFDGLAEPSSLQANTQDGARDDGQGRAQGSEREPEGPKSVAHLFIRCSKGTYVRSLAHDLGQAVGTGAHLTALRRTRSGPFSLDHAIGPEAFDGRSLPMISLADALSHLAAIAVSTDVVQTLVRGQPVAWDHAVRSETGRAEATGPVRILAPDGALVAVAHPGAGADLIRTIRVFSQHRTTAGLGSQAGQ